MSGRGQTAFVTVGSTRFDALIRAVDDMEVVAALQRRGFSQLVIQLGSGTYLPSVLCAHGSHQAVLSHGFKVLDLEPCWNEQLWGQVSSPWWLSRSYCSRPHSIEPHRPAGALQGCPSVLMPAVG